MLKNSFKHALAEYKDYRHLRDITGLTHLHSTYSFRHFVKFGVKTMNDKLRYAPSYDKHNYNSVDLLKCSKVYKGK